MVPMIDVVFLLLIFFLLSANFRSSEGYVPASLPKYVSGGNLRALGPLLVRIYNEKGGGFIIEAAGESLVVKADAAGVGESVNNTVVGQLDKIIAGLGRLRGDLIKLKPCYGTSWEYVVQVYNALWQGGYNNIVFATVEEKAG